MAGIVEGWLASEIISKVVDKAFSYLEESYDLHTGSKDLLNKLKTNLPQIQAVIEAADRMASKDQSLATWLRQLKDAACEADNVLDGFEYKRLRDMVEGKGKTQVRGFVSSSVKRLRHLLFADDDLIKLRDSLSQLDSVASGVGNFLKLVELDARQRPSFPKSRETISFISPSEMVVGRDVERDFILEMLVGSNDQPESSNRGGASKSSYPGLLVIPILGPGGVGKTALARLIYNHPSVKENFSRRIWIYVSEEDGVEKWVVSQIIPLPLQERISMESLVQELVISLEKERLLLVLDDVWDETGKLWEVLHGPLKSGSGGSAVLVTSQSQRVADIMGTVTPIILRGLEEDDYWQLFKHCAFGDSKELERNKKEKLESIGIKIAKKLHGFPLAAKALGKPLRSSLDEDCWTKILNSEWWELAEGLDSILPSLGLSYQHLDARLKQCFAYCSVFPKNYWFDKDRLVQMWIAQGFIRPNDNERIRMEDIGSNWFAELTDRSFFQPAGFSNRFVMHDLMRELAVCVSSDEYFIITKRSLKPPKTVCHLSIATNNLAAIKDVFRVNNLKSLRSVFFFGNYDDSLDFLKFLEKMFSQLTSLRVLDLSDSGMRQITLPDAIGDLTHLRYLDLSCNLIEGLPGSLCNLYHLQVLNLRWCPEIHLPTGLSNLINLRHLYADGETISRISGIGKLTCLQELEEFQVKETTGHKIGELKTMREIRGRLLIKNLENVTEAKEARLDDKEHLNALGLEWGDFYSMLAAVAENVLDDLKPPANLKILTITNYCGTKSPAWMTNLSLIYLESIDLHWCREWRDPPPLGNLRYLRSLHLRGMEALDIGVLFSGSFSEALFPSLEELVLEQILLWEKWPEVEEGQVLFPRLHKLHINRCPHLRDCPPFGLPLLVELVINSCVELNNFTSTFLSTLTSLSTLEIGDCPRIGELHLQHLHALEKLYLRNCPLLGLLEGQQNLRSLKKLEIVRCPDLISTLHERQFQALIHLLIDDASLFVSSSLPTLRLLEIKGFHEVKFFSPDQETCFQHLTSLRYLDISSCHRLICLPESLTTLSSLEKLFISSCPKIMSLPWDGMPTSLKELHIFDCPILEERCRKERGDDWPKIAHIPYIRINHETVQML